MYSAHKLKAHRDSEKGFVLMAAIMGMMILMAVGFLALTLSSDDIKISARILGERKAFSAAEAGVHDVCLAFGPTMAGMNNVTIDPAKDPNVSYSAMEPDKMDYLVTDVPGSSSEWQYEYYNTIVTGRYASQGSTVSLEAGFRYETTSSPRHGVGE